MTYWARARDDRPSAATDEYSRWLWTDHDGLQLRDAPPPDTVPTQHVWAWGKERWAYWREEPARATVGIELVHGNRPAELEWEPATVVSYPSVEDPGTGTPRPMVRKEPRFLSNATVDVGVLRGKPARILRISAPSNMALIEVDSS